MRLDSGEIIHPAMASQDTAAMAAATSTSALRARLLSGSMIMLVSSAVVGATNFIYNIAVARLLGADGFGQASAVYTLLMLLSCITLAFQLVCSKLVAKSPTVAAKAAIYRSLHRRSWQVSTLVGVGLVWASPLISRYLNFPGRDYVLILGVTSTFYIPLGVRRGLMQGAYDFRHLAQNFVIEVVVKLGGALVLLHYGYGVMGVIAAMAASVVAAYLAGRPTAAFNISSTDQVATSFDEGMQAIVFFIGQVIINNIDILLVKHFFPAALAGLYAAVALVGRVVYMLSWSIVSTMFPVSAGSSHERSGRTVMGTAFLLVVLISLLFTAAVWLAPNSLWMLVLGKSFMANSQGSFSALLVLYAALTGIYSFSVVMMTYEMSRRIANTSWLQLAFGGAIALGIYMFHNTLHDVITVQLVLMIVLLVAVSVPFLRTQAQSDLPVVAMTSMVRLRRAPEDEVVAEFLKAEFYQPEFDPYRGRFTSLVYHPNLENERENTIRRALLFRRRGRMWRELPKDTEWWQVQLGPGDVARIRAFPRKQWRAVADGSFYLNDLVDNIRKEVESKNPGRFGSKMRAVIADVREQLVPDSILLIGIDEESPLTVIEGNHRMAAAILESPETVHERFRFYCGFSPRMTQCCWYQTDLATLSRYATNIVRYMFHDRDYFIQRTLRGQVSDIAES
jgi:O-antigen/teichoic acid export membrane protein